jgi:hypothetical protein
MMYKVLWFDDEHSTLENIKDEALVNDIELLGFSNADDGIEVLEKRIEFFDAVIIDGKFFDKRGHTGDNVSDSAFVRVARKLDALINRKAIPWFILSGQVSFTKEVNPYASAYKENKVYDKNNDRDFLELWSDIKKEASNQKDTQLRHRYKNVFEVCTDQYIGRNAAKYILVILKEEGKIEEFLNDDLYFNPLRKIMEDFFKGCIKFGLLPSEFVNGENVSLNEAGKFFLGYQEKGFQISNPPFPNKIIADNINSILQVCQPASHRGSIDAFLIKVQVPYLLLSITYQVLNVLSWFKVFVDESPNPNLNKQLWSNISIEGMLEFDGKNYYVGNCLLLKNRVEGFFRRGDVLRIIKYTDNTNPTSKQYKYFASSFIKVN